MIVPVTVTGSVVAASCLLPFEPVCANASGAISAKARVKIILVHNFHSSFLSICLVVGLIFWPFTEVMRKSEREVTRKAFRENKCPGQARERQAEKLDPGGDQP